LGFTWVYLAVTVYCTQQRPSGLAVTPCGAAILVCNAGEVASGVIWGMKWISHRSEAELGDLHSLSLAKDNLDKVRLNVGSLSSLL